MEWAKASRRAGGAEVGWGGGEVTLATMLCKAKTEINVAYFAAHLEADKANANVELRKHTHTHAA